MQQSFFQRVYDDRLRWFFEKGYHERLLGSSHLIGPNFAERFKAAFDEAIEKRKWNGEPYPFSVDMVGFFGRDRVKAEFRFDFEYEPVHTKLFLKQMVIRAVQQEVAYRIHDNYRAALPVAKTAYEQVVLKAYKLAHPDTESESDQQAQKSAAKRRKKP